MIYYPLSTLMLAGIREILIITTPQDRRLFQALLGDGAQLGLRFRLRRAAASRDGLAAGASSSGAISSAPTASALILGDKFSTATACSELLTRAMRAHGAARRYSPIGSATRSATASSSSMRTASALSIEEKPKEPQVELCGDRPLFLRQPGASTSPRALKPSARGELEITDVNQRLYGSAASCMSRCSAAASPGSIPARTRHCSRPVNSCRFSSSGRGCASAARKRSR